MTEEISAAQVAADEVVAEEAEANAVEATQEQPPAEADAGKSEAAQRRERRKAHEQKLREDAEAARKAAESERQRRERILAATGEAPKEADFPDPIEYAAALGAYKFRQSDAQSGARFMAEDAQAADDRAAQADAERRHLRAQAFAEESSEARKVYADYDQALAIAADPSIVSRPLSEMVLESDRAADVAYFLGKNPAVAVQLSRMAPVDAARELGRIEARIATPQPKTQTNAPAPISPVNGRGAAPTKRSEEMSLAEFTAWRESGGIPTKG